MLEKQTIINYNGVGILTLIIVAMSVLFATKSAVAQAQSSDVSEELEVTKRILGTPQMKKAISYVNDSDSATVEEWRSLCQAYGPSYKPYGAPGKNQNEIRRSRLIYKLFRTYGLENVHIDDAGNVIGIRSGEGDGPTVVLNAHHDNVALWPKDQPIQAYVADGRMWCPAAGDDLSGVTQMLTVLRALNAAQIQTKGDIWFVAFTGEEVGSYGAEHFVRANYPDNIDWRDEDILMQFHGGGGKGVSTGSNPYMAFSQLRVFVPLDTERWRPDAVAALGPIISRVNDEMRDKRAASTSDYEPSKKNSEVLRLNMPMVKGSTIMNGTTDQAWIRFDLRSPSKKRLRKAHHTIRDIAEEVTTKMGDEYSYQYEINMKNGTEGIEGWDKVDNKAARMAVAASKALYGTDSFVDPTSGCGDCRRAYVEGMPAFSLRGSVVDYGEGDRFKIPEKGERAGLQSDVRLKSAGHDVTESKRIVELWSGIKHGLLYAVSYTGLAQ